MLAQPDLGSSRQDDNAADDDVGLLVDAVEHLGDDHIARGLDDALSQALVAGDEGVEVSFANVLCHRSAEVVDQVLPRLRRHVLGCKPDTKSLQHLPDVVQLEDVGEIQPHDDGAAVGNPLDEATALERAEHLADARAHAELVGQIMLAQLGAWRDLLAGDALAQRVHYLDGGRPISPRAAPTVWPGLRPLAQPHDLLCHRAKPIVAAAALHGKEASAILSTIL